MGRGRSQTTIALVRLAGEILEEIQPASVRAVCYQLFIRGAIPSMEKDQTDRVGTLLTRAREEGEIPWAAIVQEGRAIERVPTWANPAGFARAIQGSYRRNKWAGQPKTVIVVSEKGTVRGTLEPVLDEFEVDFLAAGGYTSATRVKELAERSGGAKPVLLLYLGDHDPSGRGMSDRDLPGRLLRYVIDDPATNRARKAWLRRAEDAEVARALADYRIEVRRIALIEADTAALGAPLSFPASDKALDTRYPWFVERYGTLCWELDAMNPNDLRERVSAAIQAELDRPQWDRYVAAEDAEIAAIAQTLTSWASISGLARE